MTHISVFTGSRSDFGLLMHLAKALEDDNSIDFTLIVSGNHFSDSHGFTSREIDSLNFKKVIKIPLSYIDGEPLSLSLSFTEALSKISEQITPLKPDILCILGDRYEAFAAATSAFLNKIKVAHFHGGECTLGALDNSFRDCISHLSTYHFTSAPIHKLRVQSLVPQSSHVYDIGPMVLDTLYHHQVTSKEAFCSLAGYSFSDYNILVTFHPVTTEADYGFKAFANLLDELSLLDCNILFTSPNGDVGASRILAAVQSFIKLYPSRSFFNHSLGHELYISALKLFDLVIGNSSSGLIEAPLVGIPTINIGDRQSGRYRYGPVVDSSNDRQSIRQALLNTMALSSKSSSRTSLSSLYDVETLPVNQFLTFLKNNF